MTEELNTIQTVDNSPFKKLVMTIGELPTSFVDSMSYYEMLAWLCNYIENTVIPAVNNNAEALQELQDKFVELKDYVDHYFDNLDVQEEIDNKLDQMAQDGTLTDLISAYIDPIINDFEDEVNTRLNEQDNEISVINNKVENATNGSPIPAESLDDMTDTSKIYVLVSTGKWYYYDGDSWEIGGDYQTPVANFDDTLTATSGIPDSKSLGERLNNLYYFNNLIDITNYQANKKYANDGTITSASTYYIFDNVIPVNTGDVIHSCYVDNGSITNPAFGQVVEVDCYGNFIQVLGEVTGSRYTSTVTGFIKIVVKLASGQTLSNRFFYKNIIEKNYMVHNYQNIHTDEINAINSDIDSNSVFYNHLNPEKCIINQNIDSHGGIVYTSNGYFVTNLIPVKNGDVVRFYNFNTSGTYAMTQVCQYDTNRQFISRTSGIGNNTYTATADGYIMANCTKPNSVSSIENLDITINREISSHYPYGRIFNYEVDKGVRIVKSDSSNFKIYYGNFNLDLFKTINAGTNANNWNLKEIRRGENIIVPSGTDFIGPVRINNNSDFIGGIHGDEITKHIIITCNGINYKDSDIQNINDIKTDRLIIVLQSDVYDQDAGDIAFTRNVIINITENKIHISNNFIAAKNLTLKIACTGGLIACRNTIINNITMNSNYIDEAPTTDNYPQTKENTYAVFNTIYGNIQAINIKGHNNPNYSGRLKVYTNESPIRSKIYFNTYNYGDYPIVTGDIIDGEFEYIFD